MPYLIDGHNLIGKLPGIQLGDLDDEKQLVEVLRAYCNAHGRDVHVYFDNAPPTEARTQRFGRVNAHFVQGSSTADRAVAQRLAQLGRRASNWTVVSSDREVMNGARKAGARVLSSEDFALDLQAPPADKDTDAALNSGEIDEWLALFEGTDDDDAG